MNKEELKEMFKNIKIGDTFANIEIEGLHVNDVGHVLHELARKNNVEFTTTVNCHNDKTKFIYEVIKPSKKYLSGKGYAPISKKAKEFLIALDKESFERL